MPGIEIKRKQKKAEAGQEADNNGFMNKLNELLSKEISFRKQLSKRKKYKFYNDLNVLLSAGIDLRGAIELIYENFQKKPDKELIEKIRESLISGADFCDAVFKTGKFTLYEYYSLKIGEETGKLQTVLHDLSSYFKKRIEQSRKIINAFTYPIIVIITAIVAVIFMMSFIVPMFEEVFARFDRDLPSLTQNIINISHFLSDYILVILPVIILLILALYLMRNREGFKKISSKLEMKIPVFGNLIRKIHLARFCLSMELLTSSRTPLINAIQLLGKMIRYYPIRSSLKTIEQDILNGMSLHESMGKFSVYDQSMVSLVKIAEEVNKLDIIFTKLKNQYQDEVDYKAGMISNIMEPLMIVFIGLFVGLILVAMYLPIFRMSTSFEF